MMWKMTITIYSRLNLFKTSATLSSVLLRVRKASIKEWSLLRFSAISPSIFLTLSSKGLIIVRLSQRANHMVPPNMVTNAPSMPRNIWTNLLNCLSIASKRLSISLNIAFCPSSTFVSFSSSLVSLSTISLSVILGAVSKARAMEGMDNAVARLNIIRVLFMVWIYQRRCGKSTAKRL